jgi:acyl-[acyl-carrier-protein]-phospholipid O-acyltransferase/long-chain-fatty-acid--[acyl-carrier-protein] ligase
MLEKLLLRPLLIGLFRLCFRVRVEGMHHYAEAGDKVLVIANHQSFIDPLLLATFLPEKPAFAINIYQAQKWYFRWLYKCVKLYRLDPGKALSMKHLIQDMRQGAKVVVFPEGRITTSGGLMKIYEGTGLIAEKTGAALLVIHISGADYSRLSRLHGKLRQRWFPTITLTVMPPVRFPAGQPVEAAAIYDIMTGAAFASSAYRRPLLQAILDASHRHGGGHVIASDLARADMNYRQLFTRAFILSAKLSPKLSGDSDYVGVLLPNALGAMVTFTSLHMLGKIPCMLNFSAGEANILHACRIAAVNTVLTSRVFIEKAKLETVAEALGRQCKIIYLEDIRPTVTPADKLRGLYSAAFAHEKLSPVIRNTPPDAPAVILYTSGSEGTPQGVALSHANLLANIAQACARLDLTPSDIVFNAMPVFHSFGLTVGMLLPLVRGLKTFLYPSPLHYRIIPELIYDTDATIMVGTDTFFNGYARYAHDYDFWKIRLCVAGAEKLKESTRRLYAERFRVNILEGYGVTETSPVLAVNTPMEHREGTVGRFLPGMQSRLDAVEGLDKGGRLFIKGPNVMLGYLQADKPGTVAPQGEWYDTGDIVAIDAQGFVTILGRARRFAKIGGEMVSLQAVEDAAALLYPEPAHAAIAIPDERKGEQIVLFSEARDLTREQLLQQAQKLGLPEIALPKRVTYIETVPRLGNGKIDYQALKTLY